MGLAGKLWKEGNGGVSFLSRQGPIHGTGGLRLHFPPYPNPPTRTPSFFFSDIEGFALQEGFTSFSQK